MSSGGQGLPVLEIIRAHAVKQPDSVALYTGLGQPVTYVELIQSIESVLIQLRALGVEPGHRVAVVASNDVASATLLLSALSVATCCPINHSWSESEIRDFLRALKPAATIIVDGVSDKARRAVISQNIPLVEAESNGQAGNDITLRGNVFASTQSGRTSDDALLLRTSGTSAEGKIVPLSMGNIIAGANASVSAYNLNNNDCRLNVMPFFHIQGLVGSLIASLAAGGSVACMRSFEAESLFDWLQSDIVTWFSASPTMHRQLMYREHGRANISRALRFVRCGSAALTSSLRKELEEYYQLPVIESYGMTEAHQIASTPMPPRRPTSGMRPTGSEVAILTEEGNLVMEPGPLGEIVVRGANVIKRYVWPPQATDRSFTEGWLRTGDQGRLVEDGSLSVTGRIKDLINRGGEKFSPYEVEDALLRHPAVREAVVFPVPDRLYDEQAASAVVLRPGAMATEQDLSSFVANLVAPYKVPRRIIQREEIPTSPSGKIARGALAARLADELDRPKATIPPTNIASARNATEAALAGVWAMALDRPSVGIEEDFFKLGGDSLSAMTLLSLVDEALGVELPPLVMFDGVTSVARMAEEIRSVRDSQRSITHSAAGA